jgi:hypothetical protein
VYAVVLRTYERVCLSVFISLSLCVGGCGGEQLAYRLKKGGTSNWRQIIEHSQPDPNRLNLAEARHMQTHVGRLALTSS